MEVKWNKSLRAAFLRPKVDVALLARPAAESGVTVGLSN